MSELEETFSGQLRILGCDPAPTREHLFAAPARRWRFDFAWPELKLAVEIEGGIWMPLSRHTWASTFVKDAEKYNAAAAMGWRVLRYDTKAVDDWQAALEVVEMVKALRGRGPS
jgi:very-short-patch-repair endonuclease